VANLDPEIERVLQRCVLSTGTFAKTIFPENFTRPFVSLHQEIFNLLDDSSKQLVAIAAPRGWGKTSVVNLAYPAKKILFREKKFIVPVSCTATQAIMQGENLKRELLTNGTVQYFFGNLRSDSFSKDSWITATDIMVLPRGAGQQVRGILFHGSRPDLFIVDDLEDSEAVKSDEQRKKLKEWFFADLLNSVDKSKRDWKIVVIGTILHEDSLLNNLMEDPAWATLKIELCDDNFHSNWPDFMSDGDIRKLAETYAMQGLLHVFAMEFRNTVITSDAPFQQKYFQYYSGRERNLNKERQIESVVIVDPAKTANVSSDFTAIVGIGIDTTGNILYVRDIINKKLHQDEMYEEAFAMCKRLNARVLGVEVTGLNEFITYPFQTWITKNGLNIEFVELKARGGREARSKEDRVKALVPFYRRGLILHNADAQMCAPLEQQLLAFPRSRYWDVMDATAYVVELLELGERYFSPPPDASDDYDEDQDEKLADWRLV
jgi:predicted phage terminase large subunit-like protein